MPPIVQHDPLPVPVLHDYFHRHGRKVVAAVLPELRKRIYTDVAMLSMEAWHTAEPVAFARREEGRALTPREGDRWGRLFECAWFRFTAPLPEGGLGDRHVLRIDVDGEGCVVDRDGTPLLGLTNGRSVFDRSLGAPGKTIIRDVGRFVREGQIEVWVDCASNDLFGNCEGDAHIKFARLSVEDPEVLQLVYDWEVLCGLTENLPEDSARFHRVLRALFEAAVCLKSATAEEVREARRILDPELRRRQEDACLRSTAIGHGHIDLAWLWPLRETKRKGARTFATVLANMERYKDYYFCATQPQLYQWIKEDHPPLYEKIRGRVAEGRWEVPAPVWVEADNNLAGGEALVRQFLYGKRYVQKEFGQSPAILMIPDDFGYSAVLPQLMVKAGVDYLLTIKMSWDEYRPFPHHSFRWEGMDGSQVLVHMPPEGTYNSAALPNSLITAERNYAEKAFCDEFVTLFGIGDGGGGPGEEHLERVRRLENLQCVAPVRPGRLDEFFDRLATRADNLPVWKGEMFLHRHTGTFTTQAALKRSNRMMEALLRETEFVASLAHLSAASAYPAKELETIWKEMLLYQFHDILPGSSIGRVNRETRESYEKLKQGSEELLGRAFSSLAEAGAAPCVSNPLNWQREGFVQSGGKWFHASAAPLGVSRVQEHFQEPAGLLEAKRDLLENEHLRVRIGADGFLASVLHKPTGREVLAAGRRGNELRILRDNLGDAWDFPRFTLDRELEGLELESAEPSIDGPEAAIHVRWRFQNSTIEQRYVLCADSPVLEFRTEIDWQEDNAMLRARFPVAVQAAHSTSEVQFGYVHRELHDNSPAARGEYEQYMHRWVDVSEPDFGVAILNNGKYGHGTKNHTLEIDLLRSPSYPDPMADRGKHEFVYALLPHEGRGTEGFVARRAYELNHPLRVAEAAPARLPLQVDAADVFVESVKKAEDSDDLIVRLYEPRGRTVSAAITVGGGFDLSLCNLLEEDLPPAEQAISKSGEGSYALGFRPFEIHTLRMRRRG